MHIQPELLLALVYDLIERLQPLFLRGRSLLQRSAIMIQMMLKKLLVNLRYVVHNWLPICLCCVLFRQ